MIISLRDENKSLVILSLSLLWHHLVGRERKYYRMHNLGIIPLISTWECYSNNTGHFLNPFYFETRCIIICTSVVSLDVLVSHGFHYDTLSGKVMRHPHRWLVDRQYTDHVAKAQAPGCKEHALVNRLQKEKWRNCSRIRGLLLIRMVAVSQYSV